MVALAVARREEHLFISRRDLLASTAFMLGGRTARAATSGGASPWRPNAGSRPEPERGFADPVYLGAVTQGLGVQGSFYAYCNIYLDLESTYHDSMSWAFLRSTIDFHDNELKQNDFLIDRFADFIKAMGAEKVVMPARKGPNDMTKFQTNYLSGGAIIGDHPQSSGVNRYLPSHGALIHG